ncbi:MAG: PKD domain-containing protein [Desulfobulbaceae bacterium]|nr:PKD domain-containing protein [Desulfobulbaceae bacterium]
MLKYVQALLITAVVLIAPLHAFALPRDIQVQWQKYEYDGNIAGYRLYYENNLACEITDSAATSATCTIDAPDGEAMFTMTTFFQDGTESSLSDPFYYIFSSTLNAVLSVDTLEGESPLPVTFDATSSTGNIISYEWMFGDGESGIGSTITHTFAAAGSYTVTLKITDAAGATDQDSVTVGVTSPTVGNTPPSAALTSSSTVGEAPLQVQFDGSGSTDSDGTIVSYVWDMGDGGTASGARVTYTYNTPGTYNATLTVTDDGGLTDSVSTPVLVSEPPPDETNVAPEAVIASSTTQGAAPLTVEFDGSGSSDPDGEITGYAWNFGDGTSGTGPVVSHLYTEPALYTVTLQVIDNAGAATQASFTLNVQAGEQEPTLNVELGETAISSEWTRVELAEQFVNPVVVVGPLSYNDIEPATVRIRNVDPSGFDIRVQEWGYLDGVHEQESVHFLVMEEGTYTLEDGTRIEAGYFTGIFRFQTLTFKEPFRTEPVILTTVNSVNDPTPVTGRMRKITTSGFDYALSIEEGVRGAKHGDETIAFIAWEPGAATIGNLMYEVGRKDNAVTDQWHRIDFESPFAGPPLLYADMQSYNSNENSTVRYRNLTPTDVLVSIEEETSKDSETVHVPETVGYVLFAAPGSDEYQQ